MSMEQHTHNSQWSGTAWKGGPRSSEIHSKGLLDSQLSPFPQHCSVAKSPHAVAVLVPFLTQFLSSLTSQPADGNPGVVLVSPACKGLQCPQALTSLPKRSLWLLWALWGSGSFNFLGVQAEGRAGFSLRNKEQTQSLLN